MDDLTEWIDGDEALADHYETFLHGVNVGIEIEQSGRLDDMSSDELLEWLREMFEARTE